MIFRNTKIKISMTMVETGKNKAAYIGPHSKYPETLTPSYPYINEEAVIAPMVPMNSTLRKPLLMQYNQSFKRPEPSNAR